MSLDAAVSFLPRCGWGRYKKFPRVRKIPVDFSKLVGNFSYPSGIFRTLREFFVPDDPNQVVRCKEIPTNRNSHLLSLALSRLFPFFFVSSYELFSALPVAVSPWECVCRRCPCSSHAHTPCPDPNTHLPPYAVLPILVGAYRVFSDFHRAFSMDVSCVRLLTQLRFCPRSHQRFFLEALRPNTIYKNVRDYIARTSQ